MKLRCAIAAATVLVAALTGASVPATASAVAVRSAADDFYTPPATLGGDPGSMLKQEPSSFYLDPTKLLKAPASVQRMMYVSTGAKGEKTAVTGSLLTPTRPWSGPGVRPLVSYAVGTQGMADRCAPSRQLAAGSEYEGVFVQGLLARGYAVVLTDYQGLGTPGTHAYVNSIALGHDVLDAARAAERLDADRVPADAPVLVAGYSEGGNAAAAALEQHASYAPDVRLIGGYAGAVPADLPAVAANLDGGLYSAFLGYSVLAIDALYPELGVSDLLSDSGKQKLAAADDTCTSDGLAPFAFTKSSTLTKDGQPIGSFLTRPDVAAVLATLKLGNVAPDVPALVAHTTLDDVVPFAQDRAMARSWCAKGAKVSFQPGIAPTHVGGAVESYPKAFAFLEARVQGLPVVSSCGRF